MVYQKTRKVICNRRRVHSRGIFEVKLLILRKKAGKETTIKSIVENNKKGYRHVVACLLILGNKIMSRSLVPLAPKQHPVTNIPRFGNERPFFYLTSLKTALKLNINFAGLDDEGRPYRWNVRPNRDEHIGVPGAEAHEVWIRLIKPALDEARAGNEGELPAIIPLGTVRECLRVVGWTIGGWEQERLFRCIRQMGAAWCEADFWQPTTEKDESGKPICVHIKGEFSRLTLYAIGNTHVTEEEARSRKVNFDFNLEDIVYIQLHPLELKLQRNQRQQPLNNEYLLTC